MNVNESKWFTRFCWAFGWACIVFVVLSALVACGGSGGPDGPITLCDDGSYTDGHCKKHSTPDVNDGKVPPVRCNGDPTAPCPKAE